MNTTTDAFWRKKLALNLEFILVNTILLDNVILKYFKTYKIFTFKYI